MFKCISDYYKTAMEAIKWPWWLFSIFVTGYISKVDWISHYFGFTEDGMIFGFPSWIIAALIFIAIIALKLLDYATKLRLYLLPSIEVSEPFFITKPKNSEKAVRTYQLKLTNKSADLIKNCEIKIREMIDSKGTYSSAVEQCFRLAQEANISNPTKSFNIKPYGDVTIDIVKFNEMKPGEKVEMCYSTLAEFRAFPIDRCPQKLTIRVEADDLKKPIDKKYEFYIDANNILQMKAV